MFEIDLESGKMFAVAQMINGVAGVIDTDLHVDDVVKYANIILTAEFIVHMSKEAMAHAHELGHMYEWNRVGDPSARLWKHILRGRGRHREMTFSFKASQSTVPVSPKLRAVGVGQRHQFVWKAPVIEYGMAVQISPVIAKALVFEAKGHVGTGRSNGDAYVRDGVVFHSGTVNIQRAGSPRAWGAFTKEFEGWFGSTEPVNILNREIGSSTIKAVRREVEKKLANVRTTKQAKKQFSLTASGVDSSFNKTLQQSLTRNYAQAAANRRVLVQDDEV